MRLVGARRARPPGLCGNRESLAAIEAKMRAERWHAVALFSMGASRAPEADDWPRGEAAR